MAIFPSTTHHHRSEISPERASPEDKGRIAGAVSSTDWRHAVVLCYLNLLGNFKNKIFVKRYSIALLLQSPFQNISNLNVCFPVLSPRYQNVLQHASRTPYWLHPITSQRPPARTSSMILTASRSSSSNWARISRTLLNPTSH